MADRVALKEFFGSVLSVLTNSSGNPKAALAEDDGTARAQLIGWTGSAQARVAVNSGGQLTPVLNGADSGGTSRALRVNGSNQLQIEIVSELGSQTGKILGQAAPAATTLTQLYIVPALTTARVTGLWAVSRSGTPTYRIGIDVSGGTAPGNAEWIVYDKAAGAAGVPEYVDLRELWLTASEEIVVYASDTNMTFGATGVEYA